MVIYIDVLIILNTVIDYFLLKITAKLAKRDIKLWRIISGAVSGGISSLYIFLPTIPIFLDLIFKLLICAILCLITFGFKTIKDYIKTTGILLLSSLILGGGFIGIWLLYKPENMTINNSVVYFDISPVVLIISTSVFYLIIVTVRHFTVKDGEMAENCSISLYINEDNYLLNGMVDTGNSLTDIFGLSEIIIIDERISKEITEKLSKDEYEKRYRAVPISTVSGKEILNGIRANRIIITANKKSKTIKNPIIVSSNTPIKDGWNAIVNPRSIL